MWKQTSEVTLDEYFSCGKRTVMVTSWTNNNLERQYAACKRMANIFVDRPSNVYKSSTNRTLAFEKLPISPWDLSNFKRKSFFPVELASSLVVWSYDPPKRMCLCSPTTYPRPYLRPIC
ncbi:alpha/beta-Hydrolases superfamily protein [Striga asiatica]|uniref:Alpha/beta-Hydrolases superfamily protein n=1 Tax=Striga asiatica TaxID=4170 RepID=A0A5A7R201_STRAF|nr:alpha/beta-Hydrolases superfamily protein [Striga asiatica]